MIKTLLQLRRARWITALACALTVVVTSASDWPEWRGPLRDGRSLETGLPASWSPKGENLAWRVPIGSRSSPVVLRNRVYLLQAFGDLANTQERLVALDADSGKVVWDRRFSIYLSDVPQHRAGWASPSVDSETGNIYVMTVGAQLICVAPDGKIVWDRSLPEEYGAVTTHGGRTTSPIIEGGKVIVNALILAWGDLNRTNNRVFAFDKSTGQTIWVSSPQTRHYDTNQSPPIVADIDGMQTIIIGGTDGAYHAIKLNTGEPVWRIDVSKRAILNGALFRDGLAFITHGEENIGTTEMGMIAAVDARRTGELKDDAYRWRTLGFLPTFASPVMDGERLYTVDNSAIVGAFDLKTGAKLWEHTLGTLQKGSPVLADGKLYVGTENGKFYILQPSATDVKVLDEDLLGTPESPEMIIASPVVADGRVYVTSMDATYAIGKRVPAGPGAPKAPGAANVPVQGSGSVAHVQVFPYESLLAPGGKQAFRVRAYDAKGNLLSDAPASSVTWSVDQLAGDIAGDGTFVAPAEGSTAGFVKATVGSLTGQARVRVIAPLPWSFDFEQPKAEAPPAWWAGAPGKVFQRPIEGAGNVLMRPRDDTVGRRAKILMGPATLTAYTIEADVRSREQRRQRGDVGVIDERYALVLFGNGQKLELHPWQAADEMTVRVPYKWDPDKWYSMKLRVDQQPDGKTRVRGKVWPTGEAEPAAWTVEKIDPIGHHMGSPGLYADGISDVYFDNVKVYKNQ